MTDRRPGWAAAVRTRWGRDRVHPLFLLIVGYAVAFVVFGLAVDPVAETGRGLVRILVARDTLLTDYVGLGGLGASCVNAGVLTLIACVIYRVSRAPIDGTAVAALLLMLGHGMFGKNLLNIWFVLAGVLVYVWLKREPFALHINVAFFGTAVAPIFSDIVFSSWLPLYVALPLGAVVSLATGFVLVPVAGWLFAAHRGFTLYNMGFTCGVVALVTVAVLQWFGFVAEPRFIWTTGVHLVLTVFLGCLFAATSVLGLLFDRHVVAGMRGILRLSGRSPCDFLERVGTGPTLVNMGCCALLGLAYVLLIGADVNGPVVGGLFTLLGFAACGKHPRNMVPVMAGVFLATLAGSMDAADPGVVLAALFGTTLVPISGRFGWPWGVVAGIVHVGVVQIVGEPVGGLNLYNNGFGAGFVACILASVAVAMRDRTPGDSEDLARNP